MIRRFVASRDRSSAGVPAGSSPRITSPKSEIRSKAMPKTSAAAAPSSGNSSSTAAAPAGRSASIAPLTWMNSLGSGTPPASRGTSELYGKKPWVPPTDSCGTPEWAWSASRGAVDRQAAAKVAIMVCTRSPRPGTSTAMKPQSVSWVRIAPAAACMSGAGSVIRTLGTSPLRGIGSTSITSPGITSPGVSVRFGRARHGPTSAGRPERPPWRRWRPARPPRLPGRSRRWSRPRPRATPRRCRS